MTDSPPPGAVDVTYALACLRTQLGFTLMATAGVGVFLGAHWQPLILLMIPVYFASVLWPQMIRRPELWFVLAGLWALASIWQREHMEDHVYLYIAWLAAVGVALIDPDDALDELQRSGRRLLAIVFGAAALWKLLSASFLSGVALWVTGMLDDRMRPMLRLAGVSGESLDVARPQVVAVLDGKQASFDIGLSGYASVAMVLLSLGTIGIELVIAASHAVSDDHWLSKIRGLSLIVFGIVTYAFVPVLPFALILAVIGVVVTRFDRRVAFGLGIMVAVTVVRFLTL